MKKNMRIMVIIMIVITITVVILFLFPDIATTANIGKNAKAVVTGVSTSPDTGIVINEVMSSNKGIYVDERGNDSDWVELYNTTDHDIGMQGFALSNNDKKPAKWGFPDIGIKAHGYLVVFLSGDSKSDVNNGFIHCKFKLSSRGDKLYLNSADGKNVDTADIPALPGNVSFGWVKGKWQQMNKPTPGFENSDKGYDLFKKSMTFSNSPLVITEVMPKNEMTLKDDKGVISDWVEIMNTSDKDLNLKGLGLSDNADKPLKWRFPDLTIKAGGYLVVFCSGDGFSMDGSGKALHTNFRLSSYQTTVLLSDNRGRVLDNVDVGAISTDWSYGRAFQNGKPVNNWIKTSAPTPGYSNTGEGFADFEKSNPVSLGNIVISEVLVSNTATDFEGDKKYYGFVELENRGQKAVNLKGYGLTNNAANPSKFRFPDVTLQPGKQLVALTSGFTAAQAQNKKYLHTPFKLSRLGETLALYNAQDQLIDHYYLGAMPQDVSVGREEGKTGYSYFTTPSPGQPNGQGNAGIAGDVQFDKQAGAYGVSVQVALSSPGGEDIYYTLDGNTPTQSSTKYTGPITVDKTTAVRARSFKTNYIPGNTVTSTYFVNSKHTLPLISIVTDPSNLFDKTNGIYELGPNAQLVPGSTTHYQVANYLQRGQASERPASFEVFDENGKQTFEQNVGVRIQGGFSRDNQQKSLAIFARSAYGPNTMNHKFFPDQPYTEYKSLQLRDGGQNALYSKINEAVELSLVRGKINCLTQDYKAYVVYINGQYWGVYFLQEKRNQDFVTQHAGIPNNANINLLYGSGTSSGPTFIKNGTNEGYKNLLNYIKTHDMSQKANYDYLASQLDTDSFMDEMINEIYSGNSDYYNMEYYQVPGGKWKQIFYDFCWTFQTDHPTLSKRMDPQTCGSTMFNALLQYKPWKEAFLKRFAWTMMNIYPTERVISTINQVAGSIASEMPAERAKFTDTTRNWDTAVEGMRTFAKKRPSNMLQQLKSVFGLSGAQLKGYFGASDDQLMNALNLADTQFQSIFG